VTLSATFIDGARSRILVTVYTPTSPSEHAIVVLPAFGEEMNKSRRLVRASAVQLAKKGYAVVIPDLYACGDSEGQFGDARLDIWHEDLRSVVDWIAAGNAVRFSALSVRAGAMFLKTLLHLVELENLVAWQPVTGADTLRSLLRIRALNLRMAGQSPASPSEMLTRLQEDGGHMNLSGYMISSGLATDLQGAGDEIDAGNRSCKSTILSFDRQSAEAGVIAVSGERFWRALEPGPNDALVNLTTRLFRAV
jgi:exosortase A-associated hydrolase 2